MDHSTINEVGGSTGSHNPRVHCAPATTQAGSAGRASTPRLLLTDKQAAAAWGIGLTLFHALRASGADWFPRAIRLAPKTVRYSVNEVEAAIARMPSVGASEPTQLKAGREARRVVVKDGRISKVTSL